MCWLMPTGLPALSSMKLICGRRNSVGLSVAHLELRLDRRADHLLGRNAVDLLGPRPHELDAAAGDDEGLEAVGAEIGQHLQHRLVDQLGVRALEPVIARGREPVGDDLGELVHRHAGVGHRDQLDQALFAGRGQRLHVAVQHRLERLLGLPAGVLRRQRLDAVEHEGELDVHRLLDPQRAVVVEGGDALVGRHEVRSALRGDAGDESRDRRFGRAVVPGRQRIGLCERGIGAQQSGQRGHHRERREQHTAAESTGSNERLHF